LLASRPTPTLEDHPLSAVLQLPSVICMRPIKMNTKLQWDSLFENDYLGDWDRGGRLTLR